MKNGVAPLVAITLVAFACIANTVAIIILTVKK